MAATENKPDRVVAVEVPGWIRLYDDGSVDRAWNGPPVAHFLTATVPPYDTPLDGVSVLDLPADPALRLYLPSATNAGDGRPLPLLLHFHGGGFCITHPSWSMYHHFYSRLARSAGAAVVSVVLPLAPEHRLPAAVDAAYRALLYLRSLAAGIAAEHPVAERLRKAADFSRVFLLGDSSGGNLVHEVAARAGAAEEGFWAPVRVVGGILLHPGFGREERSRSEVENRQTPFMSLELLDKFPAMALPIGATKDHPITWPVGEAAPALEGLRLPPLLVAVAEGDLLRDRELEYCEAMRKAGKEVEVVVSRDVGHCFFFYGDLVGLEPVAAGRTGELIEAIKDFVDRH
ncbi:putative carboxylesterase 17 [Cocos nucifera]|uniref:Putative carboxylesterase 17 n=1 Tax=Cocos nucifera TaxID=13894 RepID=A0A8K0I651_COCNU|nr:putative carboxylesterase 17 [Cocos nucifera]